MEPEGSVRVVRADDAPDRARSIEVAHEAGEADAEAEALDEQGPLGSLADDGCIVADGDVDGTKSSR